MSEKMSSDFKYKNKRSASAAFMLLAVFLITITSVTAPPTPHNVKGTVYNADGAQVPAGTIVSVTDINYSSEYITYTGGPTGKTGSYSLSVAGDTGDHIRVLSWNSTSYGEVNSILTSGTTVVDVTLDTLRPGELDVAILSPPHSASYHLKTVFNVTARIAAIGGQDSTGCTASINFTDPSVLTLVDGDGARQAGESGNISLGSVVEITWVVRGNQTGTSDILVNATCNSDSIYFDDVHTATAAEILIDDKYGPWINLTYPRNNTLSYDKTWIFTYFVYDVSGIFQCSLVLDGEVVKTDDDVSSNSTNHFNHTVGLGQHNWSVVCADGSADRNENSSQTFFFDILERLSLIHISEPTRPY